jgi:hypothetical protein
MNLRWVAVLTAVATSVGSCGGRSRSSSIVNGGGRVSETGAVAGIGEMTGGSGGNADGGTGGLVGDAEGGSMDVSPSDAGSRPSTSTERFVRISAGPFQACGIRDDGTVDCWGSGCFIETAIPHGTFSQVSPGTEHSCALATDGMVSCWGSDFDGQATPPPGTGAGRLRRVLGKQ